MPIASTRTVLALFDRRSLIGIGTAAVAALIARPVRSETRAGQVEDLTGQGFAEAGLVQRPLARDLPVYIAERVRTAEASRMTLHLGARTRVRLGERTRLVIDRYLVEAGGDFTLESGAVLFDGPRVPAPVQIRSPFALIAVRGTRFFAGPSGDVFGVFVARGAVTVSGGGSRVIVRQGEGTDIRFPGAAPTPPQRWGEPRIARALASVS
jgi:ferric-dicitrate binding protein FerR (iron transport regulator)